jgi:nicotinamidase-related amidase
MQNDFITGSLGTPEAQAIVPNVKKKIDEAVANGDLIIYTQDTHSTDYLNTKEGKKLPVEHCIYKTDGWKIPDELMAPKDYEYVEFIDKFTFGSEYLPTLIKTYELSSSFDEIELVGLCTDICVVSNVLLAKAYYPDLKITVDANCCAGVTLEKHKAALEIMKSCQIEIINE